MIKIILLLIPNCLFFTILDIIKLIFWTIFNLPIYFISKDEKIKKYIYNNFISIDQSVNAIWGGDPDMTISGRLGTSNTRFGKFVRRIVDSLFSKNHCIKAIESDEGKDSIF